MPTFHFSGIKMSSYQRREALAGYFFILPWLLSLAAFTLYPIITTFYLSFTDYSVLEAPKWVGTENYQEIFFSDPSIKTSAYNSAYFALLSVPVGLALSLILAIILNMRAAAIGFYRTLFYLPSLVPPVASTIVFIVLFQPKSGLINAAIRAVGLTAPAWFADPVWSKPGLVLMSLWGIGAQTLIFLAGLQDIPKSLLEAAEIDGANSRQKFWYITLPLLSNVILFNLVMNVIGSFQVFTQAMMIGGTTGSPMESTLMFMVHIYRNAFRYFKMGYASALSVVMFVVIMAITLLIFRTARLWVFAEDQ